VGFKKDLRKHISKRLTAYCHGELPPEEYRRVAEHLLHCQRCRSEYEEIRLGAQLAARLAPAEAPASLWDELELMLDQEGRNADRRGAAELVAMPGFVPEVQRRRRRRGGIIEALIEYLCYPCVLWTSATKPHHDAGDLNFKRGKILVAALCSILALLICSVWVYLRWPQREVANNEPAWAVKRIEGRPKIGERQMGEQGRLAIGQWLVTDEASRAQISVGDIGEVRVEPNSRIGLVAARADEHRLAIPNGKLHAFIWAPPRQFYVDTPSAVAVDLGCTYTLEVSDDGQGLLQVTTGWVAFEWEGRESFVPAEAECVTRPRLGPGTPYFNDASREFRDSLAQFDTAQLGDAARAAALEEILRRSRKKDAITLWHLLTRTNEAELGRVYDRLAKLIPPPKTVTRDGILLGDRAMIDAWWDELELGDTEWWRMWKGPIPSQSK
jgi:Putative zinc-finger/FecR protein